jgi:hypothetical protein
LGSIPGGGRYFSLLRSVQTGSGAHKASCPVGAGDFSRREKAAQVFLLRKKIIINTMSKRHGHETDHPPPFGADFKSDGAISPLPITPSWRCS